MMAAQLRAAVGADEDSQSSQGIGQALKSSLASALHPPSSDSTAPEPVSLRNRAGESKSPYVRAHASNPVAWQLWGDEAIGLAKKENKLLFVSIGYSACHWCHVMERESFESPEVAAILNSSFIPIKIDREERPDIDRIYMNFVQATTGSGGWPLNVFVTPDLHPVFGGTYWPGPQSTTARYEGQVDFLGILGKLSDVWREQEQRCRLESGQILQQLKEFAAEGTFGGRAGKGEDGLEIELLEEAYAHFASTYDSQHGGFGSAPKFPTPAKLAFLLRTGQYDQVVRDVVGENECENAENMAISTLRKMARGGIHDHIGNGFARYSVTSDWSLPHFEKMLYDNAQLLHIYLDGFLLCRDPELLGVVYDIATYLQTTLSHPDGGFYSSEDADSYYRKGDTEKREGAFYVWTKREFESILGPDAEPILSAFLNVKADGNVLPENDAHDEFLDQNVLAIVSSPGVLAQKFGVKEEEVVNIIKEGKIKLRQHREKERVRPALDDKIVVGWNGLAIGALGRAAGAIKGFDPEKSESYLTSAVKAATFIKDKLYDEHRKILYRVWREGRGDTEGFADDYAFLIEGLIDLYEASFDEKWLSWADDLQKTEISEFYDSSPTSGGFFSTPFNAAHIILRLKDGMDTSEPSTNGVSATNLFRLSSLLADDPYASKARETLLSFESEMLQYPWLFASFMPAVVAARLGVRGIVVTIGGDDSQAIDAKGKGKDLPEGRGVLRIKEFEKAPRGGLKTMIRIEKRDNDWLRQRNELLAGFGLDGKGRVLVCADGVCQEERDLDLAAATTTQPTETEKSAAVTTSTDVKVTDSTSSQHESQATSTINNAPPLDDDPQESHVGAPQLKDLEAALPVENALLAPEHPPAPRPSPAPPIDADAVPLQTSLSPPGTLLGAGAGARGGSISGGASAGAGKVDLSTVGEVATEVQVEKETRVGGPSGGADDVEVEKRID